MPIGGPGSVVLQCPTLKGEADLPPCGWHRSTPATATRACSRSGTDISETARELDRQTDPRRRAAVDLALPRAPADAQAPTRTRPARWSRRRPAGERRRRGASSSSPNEDGTVRRSTAAQGPRARSARPQMQRGSSGATLALVTNTQRFGADEGAEPAVPAASLAPSAGSPSRSGSWSPPAAPSVRGARARLDGRSAGRSASAPRG